MTISLSEVAHLATAAAVFFAAWQIWLAKRQGVTALEDSLAKEYRDLTARLPIKAFLGEETTAEEHSRSLDAMYHYFDLCNQQAFLAAAHRISPKTWEFWKDGICHNINRPAFQQAWSEIAARSSGEFTELRAVVPPKPYARGGAHA